jgi:hypothetical protein
MGPGDWAEKERSGEGPGLRTREGVRGREQGRHGPAQGNGRVRTIGVLDDRGTCGPAAQGVVCRHGGLPRSKSRAGSASSTVRARGLLRASRRSGNGGWRAAASRVAIGRSGYPRRWPIGRNGTGPARCAGWRGGRDRPDRGPGGRGCPGRGRAGQGQRRDASRDRGRQRRWRVASAVAGPAVSGLPTQADRIEDSRRHRAAGPGAAADSGHSGGIPRAGERARDRPGSSPGAPSRRVRCATPGRTGQSGRPSGRAAHIRPRCLRRSRGTPPRGTPTRRPAAGCSASRPPAG